MGGKMDLVQEQFPDYFADAEADFKDARFVICGIPYDATVSFRHGTRYGPKWIRQAAWNCEQFNIRNRVNLTDIPIHDMGDLTEVTDLHADKMFDVVHQAARKIVQANKFPLFLGGEHSTIPPVIHAVKEKYPDLGVIQLDAHLDYRRDYHGTINNHACAMKRTADAVSPQKMVGIGIRSVEAEEYERATREGFKFYTAYDVNRMGFAQALNEALDHLNTKHIYITLDIDGIDPAYAPGTGTPEPFGLTPWDVLRTITRTADRLVGFDINEVAPAWDTGQTAALAAKLCREVMTEVWEKQGRHGLH